MEVQIMKAKKSKSVYCYLDGKEHCDVVQWALAANMSLSDAKKHFVDEYSGLLEVTFKIK